MINATANILIGGKSTRFGSKKWNIKLGSDTIINHIWNSCNNFTFRNLVGKKNPKIIHKPFILDHSKIQAPIIGLYTSIISSNTNWILLLSCDIPLINSKCLNMIWKSKEKNVEAVVPIIDGQIQPLCSLYNKSIHHKLNICIKNKKFSLKKFLKSINTQFLEMNSYKKSFFNMNTKEDFDKINLIYNSSTS